MSSNPINLAFTLITIDRRQLLQLSHRAHPANANNVNYLGRTLRQLEESEIFTSKTPWTLDIVDSGSPETFPVEERVPEFVAKGRPGQIQWHSAVWMRNANDNFLEALRIGINRRADWVVFIEDDIAVINHFADSVAAWLDDHATPLCHVYVFGSGCIPNREKDGSHDGSLKEENQVRGEWEYEQGKFIGTQCIALRTEDAEDLVAWLAASPSFSKAKHGYDCELRRWAETKYGKDTPFRCTAPSFVDHIGDESAIALGRFHTYPSFPGPHWVYHRRPSTVQFVRR